MAFSFTQTSITARTAAVAAHNCGLDNGLQGTTGVGQCGIFGPAPPREPTPSAPQFTKPPCKGGLGKKARFVPPGCNNGQAHRHGFSDLGRDFCDCVPRGVAVAANACLHTTEKRATNFLEKIITN